MMERALHLWDTRTLPERGDRRPVHVELKLADGSTEQD
jgi:hypothetical protein